MNSYFHWRPEKHWSFHTLKTKPWDFWLGCNRLSLLPWTLASPTQLSNEPAFQEMVSKVFPKKRKSQGYNYDVSVLVLLSARQNVVTSPTSWGHMGAQLPGTYRKNVAPSTQGSSIIRQQLKQSKGNHLPRQWLWFLLPPHCDHSSSSPAASYTHTI